MYRASNGLDQKICYNLVGNFVKDYKPRSQSSLCVVLMFPMCLLFLFKWSKHFLSMMCIDVEQIEY